MHHEGQPGRGGQDIVEEVPSVYLLTRSSNGEGRWGTMRRLAVDFTPVGHLLADLVVGTCDTASGRVAWWEGTVRSLLVPGASQMIHF